MALSGRRNFRIHPKIRCLNFKPRYLLNYSSRQRIYSAFERRQSSPHWTRTLLQNFARLVSLTAFQHVAKDARATLTQSCPPSGIKWPHKKTGKTQILRSIFLIFWSNFLDFGDIMSILREKDAMLCNIVRKFHSRVSYHSVSWFV